ncbi:hypothetical protein [Streptomyces sp. AK02-04a]|uniref:hypothetical protein n=1 Tax=Streptomyces sp. AK02-04a TaxID=3028649 RepID=UPI0029BBDFF9|nr:hypothetical protein [Streptomyces sp. AK02-04a]MDX3759312.1 hypothetical protein [Streptomyces sp. AK02-04a]
MPDLHGWITQQITIREQAADRWHDTECAVHDVTVADALVLLGATVCDCGGPAAVLRRCTADRKILEVHKPYGGRGYSGHACTGCGELSEDWAVEHANDCPTLLALAEGYGLTPEILATLDRPVPEPYPPVRLSGPRSDTRRVPPALRGPNWKADR